MRANNEQLEYVHRLVARGEYRVNSERVAAAMLERIGIGAATPTGNPSTSPKVVVP